jgi:antitoxin HigA-1
MSELIPLPKIGEILREEFMIPLCLSASAVAHGIHVPVSGIEDILNNGRITPDISLRLGRYFGVSERYFLDMQADIDIRKAKRRLESETAEIIPYRGGSSD